jgi:hypothetical protein
MSLNLKCTSLVLPEHAYTDCSYANPEDMASVAELLGLDAAAVVKRGTLVALGSGEVVVFLKCVPLCPFLFNAHSYYCCCCCHTCCCCG